MHQEVRLAELLCTRLCHDLTGPIGAINNGAEFLSEEGFSMQDQAMELIVGSAQQAVIRLQFYRQAYGKVNYSGEASLNEVRQLANKFFRDTRVTLDWPDSHADSADMSTSRKMAKLVLNMLIMVSATLPKGGTIAIRVGKDMQGHSVLTVRGEGDLVKLDEDVKAAFEHTANIADVTPKTVQPYFMTSLAKYIEVQLTHEVSPKHIELIAMHP